MIVVYGTRLFGKVDTLDKTGVHVATRFFHISWIPLIPLGSFLVVEETSDGHRGAKLPLSFKSVLVAYLRAACIPFGLLAGVVLCIQDEWLFGVPLAGASLGFFVASYWIFVARGARRQELLQRIGAADEAPPPVASTAPAVFAPPQAAPASAPPMGGRPPPLLLPPEVPHPTIAGVLTSAGLAATAAPPGALAQFSGATVRVTIVPAPLGAVALLFDGSDAAAARAHLAGLLPALSPAQIDWLRQHPDPTVRAEAARLVG